VGPLVFDREDRDADAAGVEADGVAEGAGHSGGLTAAVAAGEQAGQVPGVEDGGVWPDEDDRGGQNGADVLALRHPGGTFIMTTISIIGSGNMATAIGTRAAKHGHTIEVMSRDTAKAQALADKIGNGATAGTFGATPLGDIVAVMVLPA